MIKQHILRLTYGLTLLVAVMVGCQFWRIFKVDKLLYLKAGTPDDGLLDIRWVKDKSIFDIPKDSHRVRLSWGYRGDLWVASDQQVSDTPTITPTETMNETATSTTTATGIGTLTATGTVSVTLTPSPTGSMTVSPTPTSGGPGTSTPTHTPGQASNTATQLTATVPSTTLPVTPTITSTFIPFPTITLLFPQVLETPVLLIAERHPDSTALSKGGQRLNLTGLTRLTRLWPLVLLLVIWMILSLWFILSRSRFD